MGYFNKKKSAAQSVLALLCILTVLISLVPVHAQAAEPKNKRAVIICVDGLSAQEFFMAEAKMPNLKKMVESGGIALMNTNTAGRKVSEASYLTINSGAKALGIELISGLAYGGDDNMMSYTAKDFAKAKGLPYHENSLLYPALPGTVAANETKDYGAKPGLLGDTLRSGGVETYVYGNADVENQHRRYGVSMLMDGFGMVDGGIIDDKILVKDVKYPSGIRNDYDKMEAELAGIEKADRKAVVLFDLGDLQRLNFLTDYYSEEEAIKARNQIFSDVDKFIGKVMKSAEKSGDMLVFMSPTSSDKAIGEGASLTVLCVSGDGINKKSIITAGSTRRQGIVVNTDIGPTLCDYFGLNRSAFSGNNFFSDTRTYKGTQEEFLSSLERQTYTISTSRVVIITIFIALQVIAILLAFAAIMLKGKTLKKNANKIRFMLLWMVTFPAALLLAPMITVYWLNTPSYIVLGLAIALLSLLLAAVIWFAFSSKPILPYCITALLTLLIIFGDNALGGPLAVFSPLSFDPVIGARFYGIGNEFEGLICGAFIVFYASLFELMPKLSKFLKLIGAPLILIIAFLMAAPWLGADVGGTIVAFLGLGYVYLLFLKGKVNFKMLFVLCVLLGLAITGAAIFDLSRPIEQQTHLARLVQALLDEGFAPLIDIITRKIAMNIKLITITKWSFVLLTSLICLFVLYFRPVGLLKQVMAKYSYLRQGFIGSVFAAIIAFLFNDSGVVAAGTLNIFPVMLIVSLMLLEQIENANELPQGKED